MMTLEEIDQILSKEFTLREVSTALDDFDLLVENTGEAGRGLEKAVSNVFKIDAKEYVKRVCIATAGQVNLISYHNMLKHVELLLDQNVFRDFFDFSVINRKRLLHHVSLAYRKDSVTENYRMAVRECEFPDDFYVLIDFLNLEESLTEIKNASKFETTDHEIDDEFMTLAKQFSKKFYPIDWPIVLTTLILSSIIFGVNTILEFMTQLDLIERPKLDNYFQILKDWENYRDYPAEWMPAVL